MGHYFGNCGQKTVTMVPKIFVTQWILLNTIKKNCLKNKSKKERERKKDKEVLDFTLIKWLKDFIAFRFPNKLMKHQIH